MHDATLHVKVKPEMAEGLKRLAAEQRVSVGELVRKALTSCYQGALEELPRHQQQALEAYRGGYISLGKLGEAMGMTVLEVRQWLNAQDVPQNNTFLEADAEHA